MRSSNLEFLQGGGEAGARMRALDWSKTPLGSAELWPQSLKTIVRVMLDSRYAMWMLWGPDLTFFCNDAYLPTVGIKRDWVLGARSDKVWQEIWPDIGPRIEQVLAQGQATWDEGLLLFLERSGFTEETYHTFSYSPVYDDHSRIAGMLCVVTEVTERIIGERRLRTLRDLAARSTGVKSVQEACDALVGVLRSDPLDVPFICVYTLDEARQRADLASYHGSVPERLRPRELSLSDPGSVWRIATAVRGGSDVIDLPPGVDAVASPLWPDRVAQAITISVRKQGTSAPVALLIAGVSPRRALDEGYRSFYELVAGQFAAAIADAQAYESERARAEALAEIDRAKTLFFSNVSHEFRTPLTLLLGPLQDALERPAVGLRGEALEAAHRNALRLLRLVNALLDFSRLQAGRVQGAYVATDLAALTEELASVFRSTMDRAGLKYRVACASLPEPVYVDRDMWEQIVLNLLSNAFKYTFEGEVHVSLDLSDHHAELTVSDTGTGIPPDAVSHLFERFYRVPGSVGRTHEGSGIGLSLVKELVELHGGTIDVSTSVGKGTRFRVRIPLGCAHLSSGKIGAVPSRHGLLHADAFAAEAQRWLPEEPITKHDELPESTATAASRDASDSALPAATILLVDDNADMRNYVKRLLSDRFRVETAADGQAALELAIATPHPALILADVMMPRLDGFGLLKALRNEPKTRDIPVILLSARAGPEARVEGFDVGADDYLIKPFSARELVARVSTHVRLSQLRRSAHEQIRASEERIRLAIEEAGMGTWDHDLRTDTMIWSRTLFDLMGYPPEASGRAAYSQLSSRLHAADRDSVETAYRAAEQTRALYAREYRIIRADTGAVRWLRVFGRYLYDDLGAAIRSVGVMFDDTDRKLAAAALLEADRRKDEFLATLAHELRNPLAPIRNATRILDSPGLSVSQASWCRDVIKRQVGTMGMLLDDLLDIARVSSNRLLLKKEHISLNSVIESAVETARPLIEARAHTLSLTLPAEPVIVDADPIRFAQVITNLLTNAAKYTDAGGRVELTVARTNGHVELAVKDNGIGLATEDCERVFEMFSQVETAIARAQGGLGIGLALVRGLVELHGGKVSARSAGLGKGSEFLIRIPALSLGFGLASAPNAQDRISAHRRRILVADDNQDGLETLSLLLELEGHEVRTASTGLEALAVCATWQPEVAILDIGMPELTGYEVAERIRREKWGASLTLVAVTGWGQEEQRRQARAAGFDYHLTKPIEPDALIRLLVSASDLTPLDTD
jgi:PAS domain S-box-containing protein